MGKPELLAGRDGGGAHGRRWTTYRTVHGKALGEEEGRGDRVVRKGSGGHVQRRGRVDGHDRGAEDLDEPDGCH